MTEKTCDIILRLHGIADHDHVILKIFSYLDHKEISRAELVSKSWHEIVTSLQIWETFAKTNLKKFPLWKKIYKLLESDEALNPKDKSLSLREIPKAVFESCKTLERNWNIPKLIEYSGPLQKLVDFERHVDAKSSCHLQMDDNYIVLKNLKGIVNVFSRKTGDLVNKVKSEPEPPYGKGTYTVGDKLVICSGLNGVIKVWDMITNKICFEIQELKGNQIVNLKFSPSYGILMASSIMVKSQNLQSGSLLTMWEVKQNERGHFTLKGQKELPGVNVLRVLGWEAQTFGILCTVDPPEHHLVHIYTQDEPFNLVASIDVGQHYRLDWADGYLATSHIDKITLYEVCSGACLNCWDASFIEGKLDQNQFTFGGNIKVCSTHIVTFMENPEGYLYLWTWRFVPSFYSPVKSNSVSLKLMNPNGFFRILFRDLVDYDEIVTTQLVEANEFQIVVMILHWEAARNVFGFIGGPPAENYIICKLYLIDVYPPCANCGLYKRDLKTDGFDEREFCNAQCSIEYRQDHESSFENFNCSSDDSFEPFEF